MHYADGAIGSETRGSTGYGYSMRYSGVLGAVTVAGVNQTNMTFDTFRRMRVRTLYASAGTGAVQLTSGTSSAT